MPSLIPIGRQKEISRVRSLISQSGEYGILISVSGSEGIGKSTFLKMLKENLESDDAVCVLESILQVDVPEQFLVEFRWLPDRGQPVAVRVTQ